MYHVYFLVPHPYTYAAYAKKRPIITKGNFLAMLKSYSFLLVKCT
jgi:hypothetical protein